MATFHEMNNKKTSRNSYQSRGRGRKRGVVRLNAAKVHEERVLDEHKDSTGVYEDVMVYVKNQTVTTSKQRGRPRKLVSKDIPTQTTLSPTRPEVIYVPSVREASRASLIPRMGSYPHFLLGQTPYSKAVMVSNSMLRQNPHTNSLLGSKAFNLLIGLKSNPCNQLVSGSKLYSSQTLLEPNPCAHIVLGAKSFSKSVLGPNILPQPVFRPSGHNQTVLGSNVHPQSVLKPNPYCQLHLASSQNNRTTVAVTRPKQKEEISYWPEDMQTLWDTWEQLPEQQVISWLKAPADSSEMPSVIADFHQKIQEWEEGEDVKIKLISEWLGEDLSPTPPTEPPPKVVVEAQPNTQHCGIWSSMDDLNL